MPNRLGMVAVFATGLFSIVSAQTATDEPSKTVHISGRLVDPDGKPVSLDLRMARWGADGFKDERTTVGGDGRFTFTTVPSQTYRFYLPTGWGVKTQANRVDTPRGKDIDLGDLIVERCPALSMSNPKPPSASVLISGLKPEQIIIEPWQPGVIDLPPSTFKPNPIELPPCPLEPSLYTIESSVGGKVKSIRVVRYDPKLTPSQIREEVQKVRAGSLRVAAGSIMWSEGNSWNIQASVEYEDGKRTSILMDGWIHVQVEDRAGKYRFIRLSPAAQ
jgi:hypothetical protein